MKIGGQKKSGETSKNELFDLVNVTEMEFILRQTSKDALEDDRVKFTWRIQSKGETEHDLKYATIHVLLFPGWFYLANLRTLAWWPPHHPMTGAHA